VSSFIVKKDWANLWLMINPIERRLLYALKFQQGQPVSSYRDVGERRVVVKTKSQLAFMTMTEINNISAAIIELTQKGLIVKDNSTPKTVYYIKDRSHDEYIQTLAASEAIDPYDVVRALIRDIDRFVGARMEGLTVHGFLDPDKLDPILAHSRSIGKLVEEAIKTDVV
jgi:hypothetical protein